MSHRHFVPFVAALALLAAGCDPAPESPATPEAPDAVSDDDDSVWEDDDDAADDDDATSDDDDSWGDDDDAAGDDDDAVADDDDLADDDDSVPSDGEDAVCSEAFEAPLTSFVSADDSNSQAEPAYNAHLIADGTAPQSVEAKPWEYLNYSSFDFAPAPAGDLRIEAQLLEHADDPTAFDLLVAVVSEDLDPSAREPLNLVFAVDTSGSMQGPGMVGAEATLLTIAGELAAGDIVSIVQWSDSPGVVLASHTVSGPDDPVLVDAVDGLTPNGGTNLNAGLVFAFDLAQQNYQAGMTNRVILISDGGANAGVTDIDLIAANAQFGTDEGIQLTGVGVPLDTTYNATLIDALTDAGKGAHVFIDSVAEAEKQFAGEGLLRQLEVAALDVQLAITLPPGFVIDEFSGEEIGELPSEVEPQNLAPNDQMLYEMDIVDCSPDLDSPSHELLFTVEWVEPGTGIARTVTHTRTLAQLQAQPARELAKARALVTLGEVAGLVTWQQDVALDEAIAELQVAATALPNDPDLAEFLSQAQDWRALVP